MKPLPVIPGTVTRWKSVLSAKARKARSFVARRSWGDVDSAIAAREAEERKQGEACGDLAYHHCLLDEVVGTSLGWGLDLAQQALQ